jgi:epidermal growth factor receptor substrate 15
VLQVESLAKKYEDKYKQAGDAASRLAIEEATFHHLQVPI